MLELKLTGANVGEIKNKLEETLIALSAGGETTEAAPPKKKAPAKKAPAKKATKAAAKEEVKAETEPAAETKAIDSTDVLHALQKVNNNKGLAAAKEVLAKFGADRYSEIRSEDHAAFIKACDEAAA